MKRLPGIPLVALVHLACSYMLFFVSMGIGMKSLDHPHLLTSSEKIWTSVARVMLLPIADPLQQLSRGLTAPIMADPSYGAGIRKLTATVWFLGPIALNRVLWAALISWAYSGLTRRLVRRRTA